MADAEPDLAPDCRATPLASLLHDRVEAGEHFVRSHHGVPLIDEGDYVLEVGGLVGRAIRWPLADLRTLSHLAAHVVLECAGHRRTELEPTPPGVPWGLGAVGHARWAGGSLADLLSIVRPLPEAEWIVLHGADLGDVPGAAGPEGFARAIPLGDPVVRETILAWEMNGRRLEPEHGYPVRAVVPGWYAVSSVKWLTRIELVAGEFAGHYQAVDYRLRLPGDPGPGAALTTMPVSSLIIAPDGAAPAGAVAVHGIAWGGERGVAGVDVQVDDGEWRAARIDPGPGRHAQTRFAIDVELAPGRHVLRSRARDRAGGRQPDAQAWNERGYGVCAVRAVEIDAA